MNQSVLNMLLGILANSSPLFSISYSHVRKASTKLPISLSSIIQNDIWKSFLKRFIDRGTVVSSPAPPETPDPNCTSKPDENAFIHCVSCFNPSILAKYN